MVIESILNSIKKMLGVPIDDTNFDQELILHINGALMVIGQLGVGPEDGFRITDSDNTWDELLMDQKNLELVKLSVYFRVRLSFDPPQNSFLVKSIEDQIQEYDWRIELNHRRDNNGE